MKTLKLLSIVCVSIILCGTAAFAQKPDISSRPGLYIGGVIVKDNEMPNNSKYVKPGGQIEVFKSEATYQQNGYHYFYASYFMTVSADKETLSSLEFMNGVFYKGDKHLFLLKPKPDSPLVKSYANNVCQIAVRQFVGLRPGENDVTLKLDEGSAIAESNERNNFFQFKLILKP